MNMVSSNRFTSSVLSTIFLLLPIHFISALNGNGKQQFATYDGWKAFEVVTQGDRWGNYKAPGQMDGIGVSFMSAVHWIDVSSRASNAIVTYKYLLPIPFSLSRHI